MTPLKNEQKENIIVRLSFIEAELADLEKVSNLTWVDYQNNREARRNVERIAENVVNAGIDIAKILLAGEAMEIPPTYKEVILRLGEIKIIPQTLAEELAALVLIRNVLAHQYLDLKWDKLKHFIKEGPRIIKDFGSAAQKMAD